MEGAIDQDGEIAGSQPHMVGEKVPDSSSVSQTNEHPPKLSEKNEPTKAYTNQLNDKEKSRKLSQHSSKSLLKHAGSKKSDKNLS